MASTDSDHGAFMEKFVLEPISSPHQLPLSGLTFAVKDIFDVEGHVTGFGNPDWASTHCAATSTTVLDEMAYSINGENVHHGTRRNPCELDQLPRGSSSGSAVATLDDIHSVRPSQVIIPEDCLKLSGIPSDRITQALVKSVEKLFGSDIVKHAILGDYVKEKVSSLEHFVCEENKDQEYTIPSLVALKSARRLPQRYEFMNNHGEWVTAVKPKLSPGISELVWEAIGTTEKNSDVCQSVKNELRAALTALDGDYGILVIPTVPGPPPKLQMNPTALEAFCARALSLLSIAGVSGFCQVGLRLGLHDNLPVAVSLLAKHGSDRFLLNLVKALHHTLKEEIQTSSK